VTHSARKLAERWELRLGSDWKLETPASSLQAAIVPVSVELFLIMNPPS
jgi:hypothetical protein